MFKSGNTISDGIELSPFPTVINVGSFSLQNMGDLTHFPLGIAELLSGILANQMSIVMFISGKQLLVFLWWQKILDHLATSLVYTMYLK